VNGSIFRIRSSIDLETIDQVPVNNGGLESSDGVVDRRLEESATIFERDDA
jgi:hypothetical protein